MQCYKYTGLYKKTAKSSAKYDIYFQTDIQATFSDKLVNPSSGLAKFEEQELGNDMSARVYLL